MSECKTGYPQKYHDMGDQCGCSMRLPEGKSCGDCVHIKRCLGIGFTPSADEKTCSFAPSKFIEKVSDE